MKCSYFSPQPGNVFIDVCRNCEQPRDAHPEFSDAPAEATPEVAKRIRQDIRAASETLRRILRNEEPYLPDEKKP